MRAGGKIRDLHTLCLGAYVSTILPQLFVVNAQRLSCFLRTKHFTQAFLVAEVRCGYTKMFPWHVMHVYEMQYFSTSNATPIIQHL